MDYEKFFAERIWELRTKLGVSGREMSIALGQNDSYINRIENNKAFASMQMFFKICEYLQITPEKFFRTEDHKYVKVSQVKNLLEKLSPEDLEMVFWFAMRLQK